MKEKILSNEVVGSLCMALSHLIHGGIGTADALVLLYEDEQDPACKKMLSDMADLADRGESLAGVFRAAGCFPTYVCTLLTVGEQVGKTEQTLTALGNYYIERDQMNRQLRAALLYPAMLLGVLLAVMVILLVWVLPVFDDVYAQLGSRLTGFAGGLLTLGSVIGKALPYVCGVLIAAAVVAVVPSVRARIVRWWRKNQGDKGVSRSLNTARFVQALTMALSSGMIPQEAITMASALSEDCAPAFHKRCDACLTEMDNGATLAQALQSAGFLSPAHRRLLEAGSRSGRTDAVMEVISQELTEQSQERLYRVIGKVEPALVAVSCVLIGAVLLSVMLPLMHIMNAIG